LSDQVAEEILNRIARGELPPGSALPPQRELARQLDVGLSVVREAIQRLQMLKVVRTRHGSGTIVEDLSWRQIAFEPALHVLALEPVLQVQIWEARYAIEQETTRLAALRATDADIVAIESVLTAATPAPTSFEANHSLNTDFHMAIARAAKNPILAELLEPLLRIGFATIPKVFDETAIAVAWRSHRRLLKAIRAHDPAATLAALQFHMKSAAVEVEKVKASWRPQPASEVDTGWHRPRLAASRV
jgi:GntR family transcriptional repressor for pyruvate dehydrogenase complex